MKIVKEETIENINTLANNTIDLIRTIILQYEADIELSVIHDLLLELTDTKVMAIRSGQICYLHNIEYTSKDNLVNSIEFKFKKRAPEKALYEMVNNIKYHGVLHHVRFDENNVDMENLFVISLLDQTCTSISRIVSHLYYLRMTTVCKLNRDDILHSSPFHLAFSGLSIVSFLSHNLEIVDKDNNIIEFIKSVVYCDLSERTINLYLKDRI